MPLAPQKELVADVRLSPHGFRFVIENLGPIRSGELELADLTMVVSPNSFGKTFLTLGLSRMHLIWNAIQTNVLYVAFRTAVFAAVRTQGGIGALKTRESFQNVIQRSSFLPRFRQHIEREIASPEIQNLFAQMLSNPFGAKPRELVRHGSQSCTLSLEMPGTGVLRASIGKRKTSFVFKATNGFLEVARNGFFAQSIGLEEASIPGQFVDANQDYQRGLTYSLLTQAAAFREQLAFLPSERISAITLRSEMASIVQRHVSRGFPITYQDQRPGPRPLIEEFIVNFISEIERTTQGEWRLPRRASKVLGIKIKPSKKGDLAFFEGRYHLSANLLSSGIVQLLPLVLFCESPRFGCLYIEEPEVNLHVDKQFAVADYLWSSGKPMIVSTHSQYFMMKVAQSWAAQSKSLTRRSLAIYSIDRGVVTRVSLERDGRVGPVASIQRPISDLLEEYGRLSAA